MHDVRIGRALVQLIARLDERRLPVVGKDELVKMGSFAGGGEILR